MTEKTETTPAVRTSQPDMFDVWFGDWPFARFLPTLRTMRPESIQTLRVEEFTEGNEQVVRAEMPGIDPDHDVELQVADHRLYLRAERRQSSKVDKGGEHRSEFHYGSFTRSVPLPLGATEDDVKATYKDGILEVRVPLDRKAAEAKKIPVLRA